MISFKDVDKACKRIVLLNERNKDECFFGYDNALVNIKKTALIPDDHYMYEVYTFFEHKNYQVYCFLFDSSAKEVIEVKESKTDLPDSAYNAFYKFIDSILHNWPKELED